MQDQKVGDLTMKNGRISVCLEVGETLSGTLIKEVVGSPPKAGVTLYLKNTSGRRLRFVI